jgi:DNA replication protein DnaC
MPAADVHWFTNTCLWCKHPFKYEAPGIGLPGSSKVYPLTGPRTVCFNVECLEESAEAARLAAAQRDADELAVARVQARDQYRKWVPALYHESALPQHAASLDHILPELAGWTPNQSLYLYGPAGSGKSHQVACLMLKVAGLHTMEWYSTRRLIADAQASISNKRVERPDIFGNPTRPRVLVLNDLFAERATEYTVGEIGNLFDARYDAGLPIIATGNYHLGEATAKSEHPHVVQELERIASRFVQMTSPPSGMRHRLDALDWRTAISAAAQNDGGK